MKKRVLGSSMLTLSLALSACASFDAPSKSATAPAKSPAAVAPKAAVPVERQVLAAKDGWAALEGVTGGAAAKAEHVFTVSSRAELVKALKAAGDNPKIIKIKGTVNLSTDDSGKELTLKDYAVGPFEGADPYDFKEYVEQFRPQLWNNKLDAKELKKGKKKPGGLNGFQEDARKQSAKKQAAVVVIQVPSNTTIIGLGKDAKIVKGNLMLGAKTENVIIRNIAFEDAFDYFPAWEPGDSFQMSEEYPGCTDVFVDPKTGPQMCRGGRWNSQYDLISIAGAKRVWIDQNTFSDGDRPDSMFPPVFPFPHNEMSQKVQHHDGAIDITHGADLITISNNHFKDHDKLMLIGHSDSNKSDAGKLRVTLRHNLFENVGQRMPRVRYGKIHSYNNYFVGDAYGKYDPAKSGYQNHVASLKMPKPKNITFGQALGAGVESAIYSEHNVFEIKNGRIDSVVGSMKGKVFFDQGSIFNGKQTDLLKEANAADSKNQMSAEVGWKPELVAVPAVPAKDVPALVKAKAGAGKL